MMVPMQDQGNSGCNKLRSLFLGTDSWSLHQGTLEDLPDFLVEIRDTVSQEEMKVLLEKAYKERKEEEEKTLTLVSSRQHRIFAGNSGFQP